MREVPPRIARYLSTGRYRLAAIRRYEVPPYCDVPGGGLVVQLVHTGGELVNGHEEVWFTLSTSEEIAWAEAQLQERPELAAPPEKMPEDLGSCGEEEAEPP